MLKVQARLDYEHQGSDCCHSENIRLFSLVSLLAVGIHLFSMVFPRTSYHAEAGTNSEPLAISLKLDVFEFQVNGITNLLYVSGFTNV